ncbi:phosphatidylglycerol lysyltransferase domain-containing protein [Plantibacter sp. ME-Dv--P-095]|uniref:bifunctional lysylphosphatidylglycerol flippase/synthetase MprF n=1 Tax=Plantibacter sp. ME-Dv--P-095 TaxID=3040299 RepID=UPI0025519E7F|nr:phosphatidylglycerol lysyltransferase domain-containing protein [Plantibacter sp. ME-Dv--P-095]
MSSSETPGTGTPPTATGTTSTESRRSRTAARLAGFQTSAVRFVRGTPVSFGLAAIILVLAVLTGTATGPASTAVQEQWAAGFATTVEAGHWWTPLSALVIAWDPFQLVFAVLGAVGLLGVAERLMGSRRTLWTFLVLGVAGTLVGIGLQAIGAAIGELWAITVELDLTLDPFVGIVGALLAASAFALPLWRRRIRVITIGFILMFVLYNGDTTDVYRLIAAMLGLVLGRVLARALGRQRTRWNRSSHQETRTLLAATISVSAIGPLISIISPNAIGLLSYLGNVFSDTVPDYDEVMGRCAASFTDECNREIAIASQAGTGSLVLTFVPLVLLVVAAIGLRNGRRFALILTIVVKFALAVIGAFAFVYALRFDQNGTDLWEILLWGAAALVVPLALALLLIAQRRHFQVRAPRDARRKFVFTVVFAFVVLLLGELLIGWINRATFLPEPAGLATLLSDVPRRFLPGVFLGSLGSPTFPTDGLTVFAFEWVGPIFWAVFLLAMLRLFAATGPTTHQGDGARIRQLLKQGGGGTMGFMATWPGNDYWFAEDGRSAVAYRVINGIAITMSDPIAPGSDGRSTIRGFAEFCDANSWIPVFYSVHEQYLPVFAELDWQVMSVGEETLMHPPTFELTGKPWQKVRQALNRGIKEGLTTLWTTWDELPLAMVNEITSISEQWVAEKELPEMGFTLGAMEELKDPEVALMLAIGPDGRLQAITSWLPSYRDGRVVGWTIDFMRRADGSLNGVMEFLIASAALHMRETGVEVLSLSGAPLATKPLRPGETPPPATAMTRLMDFLAKTLEPAYGFSSLFRFKAKFNPTYETIYMTYSDPLALPIIGTAVGKAYLPDVSPKEAIALVRTLSR